VAIQPAKIRQRTLNMEILESLEDGRTTMGGKV
jgi:hypothetical protein